MQRADRSPTLVGREAELAELRVGLDRAIAGEGAFFLLTGEPGIGKTRLAAELAREAAAKGVQVLRGQSSEGIGAPPYWPWIQVLRACFRAHPQQMQEARSSGALAPALSPVEGGPSLDLLAQSPADSKDARFRLFDAIATALRQASTSASLAVLLDDLQWADESSVLLLQFLARDLAATRILFLGMYRDVEARLAPEIGRRIEALASDARTIRLAGLVGADVAVLIERATGKPASLILTDKVQRSTSGNPLFVDEIARSLASERRLDERDPSVELPLPERVRAVIRRRAEVLSPWCRRVLQAAAVLGSEFDLATLEEIFRSGGNDEAIQRGDPSPRPIGQSPTGGYPNEEDPSPRPIGQSPTGPHSSGRYARQPAARADRAPLGASSSRADLLAAVDEAREARIVTAADGPLAFAHDLFREVIYDDIPHDARRRLHGEVGRALERLFPAERDLRLGALAHHFFLEAPASGEAIEYSARAARRAAQQFAFTEAAAHYRRALEGLAAAGAAEPARSCRMILALGENLWSAGRFDQAREAYEEAAEIADALALTQEFGRAVLGYGGHDVDFDHSVVDHRLIRLLERGLAVVGPEETSLRASLTGRLAAAVAFSERTRAAALAESAVGIARRLGDKSTLHYVLGCTLFATFGPDNLEERLATSYEIARLASEIGASGAPQIHANILSCLVESGDAAAAEREAAAYERRARATGRERSNWILAVWRSMTALLEGRFGEVEELAAEALRVGEETRDRNPAEHVGAQLLLLRREQGRLREMLPAVARVIAFDQGVAHARRSALAWVHAELGNAAEARRELDRLAVADFGALPRDLTWLLCAWFLAEVISFLRDSRRAEILYPLLLPFAGRYVVAGLAFCGGSVERSLGLLARAASRYEDAARHFERATLANGRIGAKPWIAHGEHEHARMLAERGAPAPVDEERARELLLRAVGTARTLGMTALLARAEPLLALVSRQSATAAAVAVMRRQEGHWTVEYEGTVARLPDSRGLLLISVLVASPGEKLAAAALAAASARRESALGRSSESGDSAKAPLGPSKRDRLRLDSLRAEAEEAERLNDPLRASRAREEIASLVSEIAAAERTSGRRQRSDSERNRLAVTKAIRYSIRKVEGASPALGRLLARTIKTGTHCSYQPDPMHPLRVIV